VVGLLKTELVLGLGLALGSGTEVDLRDSNFRGGGRYRRRANVLRPSSVALQSPRQTDIAAIRSVELLSTCLVAIHVSIDIAGLNISSDQVAAVIGYDGTGH